MNNTIPASLSKALPRGISIDDCTITTFGALRAEYDVGAYVDDGAPVVVLPGWFADDGNAEIHIPDADSGEDAARQYVEGGDWGDRSETVWIDVWAWRRGFALDEDGDPVELKIDRERHTITLEAEEPECDAADGHDWQSPYEVLGGCRSNPGVWGHGGGVVIREVCAHCGMYRITDTWATDKSSGRQGLMSVKYADADEASIRWIERQRRDALREQAESLLDEMDEVVQYRSVYDGSDTVTLVTEIDDDADLDEVAESLRERLGERAYVRVNDGAIEIQTP